MKHGINRNFREWKWSSYQSMIVNKIRKLRKQEVLEWFGDKEKYENFHLENQKIIANEKYILED